MPRIRCNYEDCTYLKEGYCSAAAIELDPDAGCLTYSISDVSVIDDLDDTDDLDDLLDEVYEGEPLYEEDDQLFDNWDDDDDF